MSALSVVFYSALTLALAAAAGAALVPHRRRPLLLTAAGLFTVAGVLGILSIGVVFLAAAAVCFVLAVRTDSPAAS